MEISVLILSCVILGLNPVLPVLLYFYFFIFKISRFVTLYGFYQIKYIHTYIHGRWPLTTGVAQGRYYCNVNMFKKRYKTFLVSEYAVT